MTEAPKEVGTRPDGPAAEATPSSGRDRRAQPRPSGRDRRVHHRRETTRVWAQVDGGWYTVHDLSLGGLALDRPVDNPDVGARIDGEIHSRAADRNLRTSFEATIVRVDSAENRIGGAFTPMSPEQIDGLLSVLSAVERDFVETRVAALRRAAQRKRLRRLGWIALGVVGIIGLGFAAWIMR